MLISATASAAECAFNPLVLQALPKFRLRGVKFGQAHFGELSSLTVEMASEMRIRYNVLYIDTLIADFPQLLDFITNGRQLDNRLELEGPISDLDQIIKVGAVKTWAVGFNSGPVLLSAL